MWLWILVGTSLGVGLANLVIGFLAWFFSRGRDQ